MSNKYVYIITEHFYDDNDEEVGESLLGVASSNVTVDLWDVDDGVPENYAELALYPTYEVTFGKNIRECDIKIIGYTRWPDDPIYPRWKLVDGFFKVFVIGRPDDLKSAITVATEYLKHQLELAIKNEVIFYDRP